MTGSLQKQNFRQDDFIVEKLLRLQNGFSPRVVDLFAGCGGISLGFHIAGFDIMAAVELDPPAAKTHAMNFHNGTSEDLKRSHEKPRDIVETEPTDLLADFGYNGITNSQVDIIVGGPPCQAYARVGRAKLREVAEHPEAYLKDPRSNLYLRYLHYVRELQPLALLMENVPDVLNYGGHNIAEEISEALKDLGYNSRYTLLNSVFYGVPEMRERMFLLAYRREFDVLEWFPKPTHWIDLPKGYHGSRQVALQSIKDPLFEHQWMYQKPPAADPESCVPAITAKQALSDLPRITLHLEGQLKKGPKHFIEPVPYGGHPTNEYQTLMRNWQGFEGADLLYDHVIRYLPRDYDIFKRMNPGDQYPEAYKHAIQLFKERLRNEEKQSGQKIRKNSSKYKQIWKTTVPPYDPGKFPNKWRKMEADKPSRTLMAHLGKDGYSHIHYDSSQARTISVREAARLQSFPDGFAFQGPMNPGFRQIGNAVPPLMARALAEKIREVIRRTANGSEQNCTEAINSV